MKKKYITPDAELFSLALLDIIGHSLPMGEGGESGNDGDFDFGEFGNP